MQTLSFRWLGLHPVEQTPEMFAVCVDQKFCVDTYFISKREILYESRRSRALFTNDVVLSDFRTELTFSLSLFSSVGSYLTRRLGQELDLVGKFLHKNRADHGQLRVQRLAQTSPKIRQRKQGILRNLDVCKSYALDEKHDSD